MNSLEIINFYYPEDNDLRRLLILHSLQVRDKAMQILSIPSNSSLDIDRRLVCDGAMLHDIGIGRCNAPGICCKGTEPYLLHGTIGAAMLREYGASNGLDMEPYARICERHTGAGLTADDIIRQGLPLPPQDLVPVSLEEQLVCLADKFFSKSSPDREKPIERVRASMLKFGDDTLARFNALCDTFNIK